MPEIIETQGLPVRYDLTFITDTLGNSSSMLVAELPTGWIVIAVGTDISEQDVVAQNTKIRFRPKDNWLIVRYLHINSADAAPLLPSTQWPSDDILTGVWEPGR